MEFGFTAEQEQLRMQVRRFLDAECPLGRVRQLAEARDGYAPDLWQKMAELGWLALGVPEANGGLGLGWEELTVVLEEMGRTLFPSPFLAHTVAARTIGQLGSERQKARWLPRLATGEWVGSLAILEASDRFDESGVELSAAGGSGGVRLRGEKMFVADGAAADLLLVAAREQGGVSLFAVEAEVPGLLVEPLALVDPTQRAARIRFDDVRVEPENRLGEPGAAWPAVRPALDAATVGLCAEMVGAADAAVRLATEYAKVRRQFGQPIGRFQGIKHVLAELYVATESARSLTYYAAWALDHAADASPWISMAKATASEALDRAGEEGVQIHGAIGYTWECDAQLYYKRGRYCRNLLGSPAWHYERVLASQGL